MHPFKVYYLQFVRVCSYYKLFGISFQFLLSRTPAEDNFPRAYFSHFVYSVDLVKIQFLDFQTEDGQFLLFIYYLKLNSNIFFFFINISTVLDEKSHKILYVDSVNLSLYFSYHRKLRNFYCLRSLSEFLKLES